jgi:predicted DsbA family dithiol-disulfide isomerase
MAQRERDRPRVVVYSDYVCPFCYLGRAALERYEDRRGEPVDVDWRPFDLRADRRGPDGDIVRERDDRKDDSYYEQAVANVERLTERYGVEMHTDLPTPADSLPAQAASLYVKRERPEEWRDFDEAVFEALWVEKRDVGDADVLADLASDVGLDAEAVRDAATDESLRSDLDSAFEEARANGVTGVPTFVHGDHAARGAVPPSHLERLVEGA